jgi:sec-independent protein translocase protein TatB
MPGFGDYIFLFVLALILFGPKKMPELARQLGKLMAEFRKASNEFKMQMEEELRTSERAAQEKRIAALEAAAATPAAEPVSGVPEIPTAATVPAIATAGELTMTPPSTGLPVAQSEEVTQAPADGTAASADAVNALADSVPATHEEQTHG